MEAGCLDRLVGFTGYAQRVVWLVWISFALERVLMICYDISF